MKLGFFSLALLLTCSATYAEEGGRAIMSPVLRKELLNAMLTSSKHVSKVDIQEVTMSPKVSAPLHLHPCPTVGVITEGAITFQIEGQPVQHLNVGEAFYEPADVRVAKFNNDGEVPAKFVVFYLLGENEHETVRVLPK
jgi:quercetin dioxygenase-like cupin family protein